MTNTGEPQAPRRFLQPPLVLEIALQSEHRKECLLDVRVKSGTHCFLHRAMVVRYDSFGAIPIMVESSLYQWVKYLVASEFDRRTLSGSGAARPQVQVPPWPVPGIAANHDSEGQGDGPRS